MKNRILIGLSALSLAGLGVVGSVIFAQNSLQPTTSAPVETVQKTTVADDKETPDSQELSDEADGPNDQADTDNVQDQVGDKGNDGETNDDGAAALK
jgi:hypothetical protein